MQKKDLPAAPPSQKPEPSPLERMQEDIHSIYAACVKGDWDEFSYNIKKNCRISESKLMKCWKYARSGSSGWISFDRPQAFQSFTIFTLNQCLLTFTLYFNSYVGSPLTIASWISLISSAICFSSAYQLKKVVGSPPERALSPAGTKQCIFGRTFACSHFL